jgi:hypothetical protein
LNPQTKDDELAILPLCPSQNLTEDNLRWKGKFQDLNKVLSYFYDFLQI